MLSPLQSLPLSLSRSLLRFQIGTISLKATSVLQLAPIVVTNKFDYSTDSTARASTLTEPPRINPVGIQYLSNSLHNQLFGTKKNSHRDTSLSSEDKLKLLGLSRQLLQVHGLLGKPTTVSDPISFQLPALQGQSLDEHFQRLGHFASEPYKTFATKKVKNSHLFKRSFRKIKWERKPGWVKYPHDDSSPPQSVPFPEEDTLIFDIETMYKVSPYPTIAVALTDKAWYLWCSPSICTSNNSDNGGTHGQDYKHLIPLNTQSKTQLVIGHNVGFDRSFVLEEYNFGPSKAFFLDTQSLHVATSGLCSRQRPLFMQRRKQREQEDQEDQEDQEGRLDLGMDKVSLNGIPRISENEDDPWLNVSALNSLRDVALFHCGIKLDKSVRSLFETEDKQVIIDNFQQAVDYCARDVEVTNLVFDKVFPMFLKLCPHPVSFGALRFLSSCLLPTNYTSWNEYLETAEMLYQSSKLSIEENIRAIVDQLVPLRDYETNPESLNEIKSDPWLRQLDWSIKPIKYTKDGKRPVKNQKLPGFPEWYRALFPNKQATVPEVTIKTRIIPLLFKLTWEGNPVVWTQKSGWCFPVPKAQLPEFETRKNYKQADAESIKLYLESLREAGVSPLASSGDVTLMKIPHPTDPKMRCTTLLSKPYIHFFEKGILKSGVGLAREALAANRSGSYWMSARERIASQFVVRKDDFPSEFKFRDNNRDIELESPEVNKDDTDLGIILPRVIPMGTITRRAVENTWLTASNAKSDRIGSELKAQVKAPPGYCFVGADVDSEELWIASLVGDSVFNLHGSTPIGWMCLEGTKQDGTDMHTKTAKILGCSRNEAKIFNYGRIYGAGVKFAAQLLKNFNPMLTDNETATLAKQLYETTKGKVRRSKIFEKFWYGGSESILFNKLENIAQHDTPRTPVLGCGITSSLLKQNLKANQFLPSRINWTIQSSGVDYLHLLCCSMHYLIERYNLDARLCISIHDEIRYLSSERDKYRVAMALQISNLWTRAVFCEQMGIDDLPQNCAFFSLIDIDHVMRKEVDMDCVTPSNPVPIPPGESLDIKQLLTLPEAKLRESDSGKQLDAKMSKFPYVYREPVFEQYNRSYTKEFLNYFMRMQVQTESSAISRLERQYVRELMERDFANESDYGFADYIRDVTNGKIKKLNIMDGSFMDSMSEYAKFHTIPTDHDEMSVVATYKMNSKTTPNLKLIPNLKPKSNSKSTSNQRLSSGSKTKDQTLLLSGKSTTNRQGVSTLGPSGP